ncbi:hypothetical protein BU25DRAFT_494078 [Macroventuria anomochaeta]|uniref:Uncharacterized protein n=1 Tax=Macroventuria anomochaeta TaxID=301207 RepID=A0ACB6RS12_9PLEO|nr:uncharacterized protein BU25DRAFT_494078 [Macroventuria anomochaeta]KAF2623933.1 hypothetical protein BU25DRAFT_494078 [Macroventuria anomochaeta]
MAAPRFQIISDLHLETPIQTPSYSYFSSPSNFPLPTNHLFLLGDIGLITHSSPLLHFLRSLLLRSFSLEIFYVLGNHECYHTTFENGLAMLQSWDTLLNSEFGARFHVMERRRVDISETLTLLGCMLWTHVPENHAQIVAQGVKDFDDKTRIWDRSLDDHNADHARDLAWLNAQVKVIEDSEPHREIVVLTHHSPTTDPRANSKRFLPERPMNSAFRTDLSKERCWTSKSVKVWAFGHTHFSCQFVDSTSGEGGRRKLVVANQKGYAYLEGIGNWKIEPVVVGREDGVWKVVVGERKVGDGKEDAGIEKPKTSVRGEVLRTTSQGS